MGWRSRAKLGSEHDVGNSPHSDLLLEDAIKEAFSLLLLLPAALPVSDVADERDSRKVSMA